MTLQSRPHPAFFLFLIAPFGASSGYTTVSLAYLLTQAQVGAESVAALVALSYLPQTWKFVWAPVVDLTLNRRAWYGIGLAGTVAGLLGVGATPLRGAMLGPLTTWVLVLSTTSTLLAMAVESLIAHQTDDAEKGRAAGWSQAGNLGGTGLGGGAALWLVQSGGLSGTAAALVLAGVCMACAWPLLFIADTAANGSRARLTTRLAETLHDLWQVVRSARGALAMLIVFLPLGTGAMSNMYSIMAGEWGASANTVALVTGTLSGLLSAGGCLLGGWICDRIDRQWAYALFGLLLAVASAGMALAPRSEVQFIAWTGAYSVVTGLCYAGFSALVLEAIGRGAAATKYNLMASLSNTPIGWSTALYGWVFAQWGSRVTLLAELMLSVPAVLLFVAVRVWSGRRRA